MAKKYGVVIVGGGFGGVKAAIELSEDRNFDVALISDQPDLQVYGSLYLTITGGSDKVSKIPLEEIFEGKKVNVVIDKAVKLDRKKKQIKTKSGKSINYQAIIFSLGMITNYFGIKGLKEYSYGMKSLEEAEELKKHLHDKLRKNYLNKRHFVIVGGGPSGVEIAGVLPQYIREIAKYHDLPKRKVHVDLVERSPRLLSRMSKSISRSVTRNLLKEGVRIYTNTTVHGQTADELLIDGKVIRSHTVIWTAGMANNSFFAENEFQLSTNGRVRVDQYLQAEPAIYIIGDNADTPYSGMAQTALYDGKYIAQNLKRLVSKQSPKPYKAKRPIYVMPAGHKWAAVSWGPVTFFGRPGWWLRRLADFVAYKDYTSWKMTFSRFAAENDKKEFCPECADDLAKSHPNW